VTERQLLNAILKNPNDDSARLIYADWLEEHGDQDRSEFIRIQCELSKLRYDDDRVSGLRAHEMRIMSRRLPDWRGEHNYVRFHRGFIEELEFCQPEDFVRDAKELFSKFPITDLEIGSQGEPGWGPSVADCEELRHVKCLRLTQQRSHFTDFPDFRAILSSPHLTGLEALDASGGHRYGDEQISELLGLRAKGKMLPSLRNLRRLSLNDMRFTDHGVRALVKSRLAKTLTHLDLSENSGRDQDAPGITADGVRELIESPLWARLEELNLGRSQFADGAALRLIANALPRSRITKLGLTSSLFRESRHLDLPEALVGAESWGRLEALNLAGNELNGDGLRILTQCPHLAKIKWLSLEFNRLTQRDMNRLAKCSHLANLTGLRIGNDQLTDESLEALANSKYLTRLVYLTIDHSPIGTDGVIALAQSPNASKLQIFSKLGSVGDAALETIADSPYLGQLTTLLFKSGGFGEGPRSTPTKAGALAIAKSGQLPNLAFLRLGCDLPKAGFAALLACKRLAWHDRPSHRQPQMEKAYAAKFKGIYESDLLGWDAFSLFPWSKYTLYM